MAPCEEEEIALEEARRGSFEEPRRGSLSILINRRGSRFSDIIQMQDRKKKQKGRYRDKQGFTWRPFIAADEELPVPRVPHPHIELVSIPSQALTSQENDPTHPPLNSNPQPFPPKPPNGDIIRAPPRTSARKTNSLPSPQTGKFSVAETQQTSGRVLPESSYTGGAEDPETSSIKSNHSENSFKTASSDVQTNYIPRQVKENYKHIPPESAALERKSSVRALQQQQYSVLNSGTNCSKQQAGVLNRPGSKISR